MRRTKIDSATATATPTTPHPMIETTPL